MRHGRMFDWKVRRLKQAWIERGDPRLVELARSSLAELIARHGAVLGRRLPPKFRPHITIEAEPPMSYEEGVARHFPRYRLERGYRIQPATLSPAGVPRRVLQADCPLRHYHTDGADVLPAGLARYLTRPARVEASS
jgi:hypothetical protein